jgi:hypothetical protein
MKFPTNLLACLMAVSFNAGALEEKPAGLDDLRWKYRVILVSALEPYRSSALANLDEFAAQIEERDIAWFVLGDDELHTNLQGELAGMLRQQIVDRYFTPVPTETAVLLIGKDGTIKSRSSDLDLEATFGLIDRMPMRQAEMQRKGSDG